MDSERVKVVASPRREEYSIQVPSNLDEAIEMYGKKAVYLCFRAGFLHKIRMSIYHLMRKGAKKESINVRLKEWRPDTRLEWKREEKGED